jgi:flavin reductase (DIM6/NTAB) family NADH-FMN oxidoreductase RutF
MPGGFRRPVLDPTAPFHRVALQGEPHLRRRIAFTGAGCHLLPSRRHDLAELFGGRTGDDVDKFADAEWEAGPYGVPVLAGAKAWFAGRVLDQADWGDHVGFLLEPLDAETTSSDSSLTFQDVKDIDAGHSAKESRE